MSPRAWIIAALLPALFAVALAALLRAPPLAVDLGAPGDARFVWGFYDAEAGQGAAFRWSGPGARLLLHGAGPGPAILSLRLSGERLVAEGAPQVALARAPDTFAAFSVVPGWRLYHVLLPPGALTDASGAALPLALKAGVSRPGADDSGRDYRALGAPIDWLRLAPLGGLSVPLLRALWLAWGLALLATAAARADCALLPRVAGRPLRVAALGGAAGAGLLAWAARDPYGLAWALPPMPWALGLATILLAAGPLLAARSWTRLNIDRRWWAVTGLALLAAGQGLLNAQLSIGAGIALALAGVLLLCAAPQGLGQSLWATLTPGPSPSRGEGPGVRVALALLGAVLLLALALRLYRIDTLPFGLWRDEARHGLTALRMAADPVYRPAYVTDLRVQLPGLGLAPFAVALQLLGVHLWTMRLVTACAGALTVLPVYALVSRLSGRRGVGLLAALLVAISSWQIAISRFSFPTIFEPLLAWFGLWLFDHTLRPASGRASRPSVIVVGGLLAGACFGLAAQTYHIGRFAPLMGGLLALATVIERRDWRRWLLAVLPAALGCLLVLAPLIGYALRQPDAFNDRVGAVFVLSAEARQGRAPLAVLDDSLRRHLLMFNVQGDLNGRHHAPGRPMLDYVTGLGFLLGLAALLRRISGWRSLFLLAALGVGLLPSALSVDSPHGMRAFEAAPMACVIAAIGLIELLRMLWPEAPRPRRIVAWSAAAALGLALALNAWVYFVIMPPNPEVFLGFYPVQSQMGAYVRDAADARAGGRIYVPRAVAADQIFAFLSAGLRVESFDGAALSSPPRPGDRFLVSGYFAEREAAALAPFLGPHPRPLAEGPGFPDGRGPTFLAYEIP